MVFQPKRDGFFYLLVGILVAVPMASLTYLLHLRKNGSQLSIYFIGTLATITISGAILLIWSMLALMYRFEDDHLHIQMGPFNKRVPYEQIQKAQIVTSHVIGSTVTSIDAIAITFSADYKCKVRISPANKEAFLLELQQRVPEIEYVTTKTNVKK